jgi:hypothetical protein
MLRRRAPPGQVRAPAGLRRASCTRVELRSSPARESARSGRAYTHTSDPMSKLLRGVAAGYGAKKLGGGCFSTVLIFILLWWLLGHFGIFQ